ncbi:MAG: ribonuclease R [Clostridia bacterium]|nr:ribonuclease R [Clostridia bacterium]
MTELKREILKRLKSGEFAGMDLTAITRALHMKPQAERKVRFALDELVQEGKIVQTQRKTYCALDEDGTFTGILQASAKGFGFIKRDDGGPDMMVPKRYMNGAYDGDLVSAVPVPDIDDDTALITQILERGLQRVVGNVRREQGKLYVRPDNPRHPEVFVPRKASLGANDGDKVVAYITDFTPGRAPEARITEIIGESLYFDTEETATIIAFGLSEVFPDQVLKEADEVCAREITPAGRQDFRGDLVFTIDGEDTRDMDDAVSLVKDGDRYILGVHIADVSGYVKAGSHLDKEAYDRGTSVYFPDKVLPMLPVPLSNGCCSLNENEDRYTLSCVMTFDSDAKKLSAKLYEGIIRSAHKTTYPEISALLEGDTSKYPDLYETVQLMKELCLKMEAKRAREGKINLEIDEPHIYMDGDDNIQIPPVEHEDKDTISHRIIEEFMIAANESVAEYLAKRQAPCLYRVHERPDDEKVATFIDFVQGLGVRIRLKQDDIKPLDFARILEESRNLPQFATINQVMLRTMQKARYCEENLGHFGLASPLYCHFTSPIRRYPDLFVHRAVKAILHNSSKDLEKLRNDAHQAGIDCSAKERNADEAERAVDTLYKVAYIQDKVGQQYDAVISGVSKQGIYAVLDNTVEGLIPIESLDGEYECIPEKFTLSGRLKSYTLGQKIRIEVADTDAVTRRIFFREIT